MLTKQQGPQQCVNRHDEEGHGVMTTLRSGGSDSNVWGSPGHLLHESILLTRNTEQNPKVNRFLHSGCPVHLLLYLLQSPLMIRLLFSLTGPETVPGTC